MYLRSLADVMMSAKRDEDAERYKAMADSVDSPRTEL
jgi:hypothetical protein